MTGKQVIQFRRINNDADIPLPSYMTSRSAGMDICAAVDSEITLWPGDISLVPTGFAMAIPEGFEAQIRPRSGLAVKHGISIVNSPGTIDSDYRGEIMIAVINHGRTPYTITRGDRIAQMVVQRVYTMDLVEVANLDNTIRDSGGFGHTGK